MRLFGISIRGSWTRNAWIRIPLNIIGLLCISAAIWFGFAMIPLEIFQTVWLRASLIGFIWFIVILVFTIKLIRRRRAARALEDSLKPEPVGDGAVIAERMDEAMAKLKASGGKTYLYDLPWYIIIGPPGAGKTTALQNSGIEFPGNEKDGVSEFGGTKNCDWWFAEDAVLIDTAGRYTTQDSDKDADEASWTSFLENLKAGRPNQPINGVILAFSSEDMMSFDEDQLRHHAETVRDRLGEMHQTLKIDFPVYVMFTKADIISGFREYFSSFSASRRKLVWGSTFQTKDRKEETWQQVEREFDSLVSRLSDEVIDRMSEEPDGVSRISIFGLPGQMALMRSNITEFLRRVFEPTQYKTNAILRGFYFTSGTQEGTPIDQVLGAMNRNIGGDGFQPDFMSGKGKSYFLHDLLSKVIFEEQDWVSHDARAVRRTAVLRTVAIVLISAVTLGAMGAFGYSFWRNATLVAMAQQDADAYFGAAQGELNRTVISDTNPSPVMPYLQTVRLMTAGYGDEREPGFAEQLGLSQYQRVNLAAERAYSDALERMLRPRMILHMENTLPQLVIDGDTAGIYRALKVYLLLGNQQVGAGDDAAIQSYFEEVWRQQFNSAGQIDERDQLREHLSAMLELDDGREPLLGVDAAIVRNAQEAIVDLPLADQAYASIQDRAVTSGVLDWVLEEQLGGRVAEVFETTTGEPLNTVKVPAMYTFEGYWGFFVEELTLARQNLEEDQWVLGDAAGRVGYEQQLATLERELHRRYQIDFVAAWEDALSKISIQPMSVDAPNYEKLASMASPTNSPFLHLVERVQQETNLIDFYLQLEALDAAALASGDPFGQASNSVYRRMWNNSSILQRIALDFVSGSAKSTERAGGLEEETQRRQVERITDEFEDWHALVRGEPGQRPIDAIVAQIGQVRDNRRQAALAPTPMDEQMLQPLLASLTANNTAYPDDVGRLLNEVEREFRSVAEDATISELNRALNEQVTAFCTEAIAPNYPFGSGRPVSPSIFGQFFGPNGRMDNFYSTYLQPHVVRTSSGLEPAPNSPIGDRLNPAALREFERAEKMRLAFFASGSPEPSVGMSVEHASSSPGVDIAVLTINGGFAQTQAGGAPSSLDWPGNSGGVKLELFPAEAGRANDRDFEGGRWAIVDFLRRGNARASGNLVEVTHQVGGRTITYKIEFDSTTVPFLMPELSDFSCPTSLE